MSKLIDLIGRKFGKLTVIKKVESNSLGRAMWLCKCDCGNEVIVQGTCLRNGNTKSCGCLRIENSKSKTVKHNLTKHRIYNIYIHIKQRCNKPKCKQYKWYGAKGIQICEEWEKDFINFYNWAMANGYKENLSIDRINVNGNYEPSNCRWVDMKTQQNNRGNNFRVKINNQTHTLPEWAEIYKISIHTIRTRLARGWKVQEAITTKVKGK